MAAGFACALALLSVIGIVSYQNVARWRDNATRIRQTEARITRLAALPGKLAAVESAQQAFQLSGAERFARQQADAAATLAEELEHLRSLAAGNPAWLARVAALDELRRASVTNSPPAVQAARRDQFRQTVAGLLKADQDALSAQEMRMNRSATVTETVIIGGGLLAFGLVGGTLVLVRRDFLRRRQAEALLRRTNDELEASVAARSVELRQTNESLRESERRAASIISSAMDGIITVDEKQRIVVFNAAAETMFQRQAAELIGQPMEQLIPERFRGGHGDHIRMFDQTNVTRLNLGALGTIFGLRASGEEFPLEASISQVESGGQKFFTVIVRDITERQRSEQALRERAELEARISKIITTTPGVIYAFRRRPDGSMCIPFASPAIENIYGLRPAELVDDAAPLFNLIHGEDLELVQAGIRASATGLKPWRAEFRVRSPQRGEVWIEGHSIPEREPDGGTLWYGVITDITVHKRTEERLRYQLYLLKNITDKAAECIFVTDTEGRVTFMNPEAERVFGFSPVDLLGASLHDKIHHHHADGTPFSRADCPLEGVRQSGQAVKNHEDVFFRKDGSEVYALCSNAPLEVDGSRVGVVLVVRDIGERKQAEEALRTSHAQLEVAQDLAQIGSFEVDLRTMALKASRPLCRLLGLDPASPPLRLEKLIEFVHPEDRVRFFVHQRRGQLDGRLETFDFRSNPLRGSLRYFTAVFDLVTDAEGIPTGYTGTILDISERKAAEAELREGEERLRQIAGTLRDAIWLVDSQTQRVLYVNQSFERICGRTCAEFYENPDAFNEIIHPDDKDRVLRAYFNGASVGTLEERHRIVRPDGEVRWVHGRTVPVRNAAGETYRIASILEDVTRRVEAERLQRSLEEQLRQAQKMEAIGTLAGGIAHDFNNVLAGILGSVELARMEIPNDHPAQQFLQPIFIASNRARELVQQILTFSRRQDSEKAVMKLQGVVTECVKLLRSTIPAMVRITYNVDRNCGPVMADPIQVHQVIMNICTNAWHALPPQDGHIDVKLAEVAIGVAAADRHPDLRAGTYAHLAITDNGCGMEAATLQRIFEPFFTTKPSGKGTGLGLSVVHGIIKAHQGAILVQSEPGKGSTFNIYLPVQTEMASEIPTAPRELAQGRGERILFVDDEQNLAAVTEKVLTRIGYTVTRFSKSDEALECFRCRPDDFDLVITDLAMPGMSGTDLAAALMQLRANIPILLISGFVDPVVQETAHFIGIREVLHKPLSIEALSEAVGRVLAGTETLVAPSLRPG